MWVFILLNNLLSKQKNVYLTSERCFLNSFKTIEILKYILEKEKQNVSLKMDGDFFCFKCQI